MGKNTDIRRFELTFVGVQRVLKMASRSNPDNYE